MVNAESLIQTLPAQTTKTSGTAWFTSFTVSRNGPAYVSIGNSTATAFTVQVTRDGTNYVNGAVCDASGSLELYLSLKAGDVLNFKQTSGSTITFAWCDVFR